MPFDADRAWTQTTEGGELKAEDGENNEPRGGALMLLLMQRRAGKRLRATAVPRTEAALRFKVENIVESGRNTARVDAISKLVRKAEAAKVFECDCSLLLQRQRHSSSSSSSSSLLPHQSRIAYRCEAQTTNIYQYIYTERWYIYIDNRQMSRGLKIRKSFETECLFNHTTAPPEVRCA